MTFEEWYEDHIRYLQFVNRYPCWGTHYWPRQAIREIAKEAWEESAAQRGVSRKEKTT